MSGVNFRIKPYPRERTWEREKRSSSAIPEMIGFKKLSLRKLQELKRMSKANICTMCSLPIEECCRGNIYAED